MTENILNPDGLLVVPGPSNLEVDDEKMQLAETDKEDDLLRESDNEEDVGDSFPLTQRTPKDKRNKEQNHRDVPNSRKRRYSQTLSAEEKIEHAEKAIKSLKRHTERGTCPSSLQYRARARINADTDFKTDIKRIRKNAEQEFVKALTRFHYRQVDRFRSEIKKGKRPKTAGKNCRTVNSNRYSRKAVHSAPRENTVTINNVHRIAETLQEKISQFSEMMSKLEGIQNKQVKKYKCLLSESYYKKGGIKKPLKTTSINETKRKPFKVKLTSKKRYQRRKTKHEKELNTRLETNKKHIKNLSDKVLTNEQISLLGKGLKFIPTPVTNETQIKKQLLRDFDQFARRMRLQYIYHGEDKEPHPFHVKSTWNPPVQPSVALESYLEEVKIQLAEIKLTTPKNNLNPAERDALKALKRDTKINLKKADKGTTTVVLSVEQKIREGQNQLNNEEHYRPLTKPMVEDTKLRVHQLINELYQGNHIDEMTKKWLYQTPDPHRIPIFYTLTKIHKPTPVGRPIISGCDGPTEKLSSFVDKILQPIAQQQESYLKDTTHFINFLEKTKVPEDTILVSMDVTSLYTNIPQEEGIHIVCKAYDAFYKTEPPIPTHLLQRALRLILTENSFHFNGRDYLQIHGTAMGTKMAVAFANIFMAKVETVKL